MKKKRKKSAQNDNEKHEKNQKKDHVSSISVDNCSKGEKMDLEIENEEMNNSYSLNTFDINFKTLLGTTLRIEKVEKSNDTNLNKNNLVQNTCRCPKGIISNSVEKYLSYVDEKYENNFGDGVSQYDNCDSINAKNVPEQEMNSDRVSLRQKDLFDKMKELILPRLFLAREHSLH